jgi:hypothetical protein
MLLSSDALLTVFERDVDLLVLDALYQDDRLACWLLACAMPALYNWVVPQTARHSVSNSLGESDIVVVFQDGESQERFALLIENKIDAEPQPGQADRYRLRGKQGCEDGSWHSFTTMMLAPEAYLAAVPDANAYDIRLSYEDLQAWFLSNGSAFKAHALQAALNGSSRRSAVVIDEAMTTFFVEYGAYVNEKYPAMRISRPKHKRPVKSSWAYFKPLEKPVQFDLVHKADLGLVELSIPIGRHTHTDVQTAFEGVERNSGSLVKRARSTAIQISVPVITFPTQFEREVDLVDKSLLKVAELNQICGELCKRLPRSGV